MSSYLKKFSVLVLGLLVFRFITAIPLPQIDSSTISSLIYSNQFLGALNLFSGGGLANFSIGMLSVIPYITVSIILQLLIPIIPALNSLQNEEGEVGRAKVRRWTRVATVPMAAINAVGFLSLLKFQGGLPDNIPLSDFMTMILFIVAGSVLLMWLGELMSEYGIGNGISLILFGGIVVSIPTLINQSILIFNETLVISYMVFILIGLIFVLLTVYMEEAIRPMPISHARYGVGGTTGVIDNHLPIKVNIASMLPIIFASIILGFFQFLFNVLLKVESVSFVFEPIVAFLSNGYYYGIMVGLLTFAFTYYTAPFILNAEKISKNLAKQGVFIPGIRPGEETQKYISRVSNRVTFYAAIFLMTLTMAPFLLTGTSQSVWFAIGGSGLLILTAVVLDVYRKTRAAFHY